MRRPFDNKENSYQQEEGNDADFVGDEAVVGILIGIPQEMDENLGDEPSDGTKKSSFIYPLRPSK
ncbi:hypothetical protein TcasGA2_TC002290 [Tribolium castaneum]|uniref:Uncharacterized protein n=1 Tax=Tribolium castaneum TaxID=7070 RepID=D7EHP5_TRICA|nr:hypothetical protein TcasGA2_TC002290 [Tribolium castaneum]